MNRDAMIFTAVFILGMIFSCQPLPAQEGFSLEERDEYNQWRNKFDSRDEWYEMEFNENFDYKEHKVFFINVEEHGDTPYVSWWNTPRDDFMVRFQYEPINKTYTAVLKVKPRMKSTATLANFTIDSIGRD